MPILLGFLPNLVYICTMIVNKHIAVYSKDYWETEVVPYLTLKYGTGSVFPHNSPYYQMPRFNDLFDRVVISGDSVAVWWVRVHLRGLMANRQSRDLVGGPSRLLDTKVVNNLKVFSQKSLQELFGTSDVGKALKPFVSVKINSLTRDIFYRLIDGIQADLGLQTSISETNLELTTDVDNEYIMIDYYLTKDHFIKERERLLKLPNLSKAQKERFAMVMKVLVGDTVEYYNEYW